MGFCGKRFLFLLLFILNDIFQRFFSETFNYFFALWRDGFWGDAQREKHEVDAEGYEFFNYFFLLNEGFFLHEFRYSLKQLVVILCRTTIARSRLLLIIFSSKLIESLFFDEKKSANR